MVRRRRGSFRYAVKRLFYVGVYSKSFTYDDSFGLFFSVSKANWWILMWARWSSTSFIDGNRNLLEINSFDVVYRTLKGKHISFISLRFFFGEELAQVSCLKRNRQLCNYFKSNRQQLNRRASFHSSTFCVIIIIVAPRGSCANLNCVIQLKPLSIHAFEPFMPLPRQCIKIKDGAELNVWDTHTGEAAAVSLLFWRNLIRTCNVILFCVPQIRTELSLRHSGSWKWPNW